MEKLPAQRPVLVELAFFFVLPLSARLIALTHLQRRRGANALWIP